MVFTAGSALLDAVVLSVVSQGGTYGYKITQDVRKIMDVSESTLYPVLRRLQKDGCLETYDMEFQGRNRRYYKITSNGMIVLDNYRNEWRNFSNNVNGILMGDWLQINNANIFIICTFCWKSRCQEIFTFNVYEVNRLSKQSFDFLLEVLWLKKNTWIS